ncbi:hypothetical protein BDZ97DRAFT_529018 [Flammula alnicola]|nr:hypothetical protein BDZ97DRAFT_529018 [Flammula alnicola]
MPRVTIQNTFGALEIGSTVAVFLFGIVTMQCHVYFSRFGDDRLILKALVASVWLLELGHTIAISYDIYRTTILLYGRPEELLKFPGFGGAMIMGTFITMLVQLFFTYRVWSLLLSPWCIIGLVCAVAAITRAGLSLYAAIGVFQEPTAIAYSSEYRSILNAIFAMAAIIDIIIATAMVYFLIRKREQSLRRTTRLIDRLIVYSMATGLCTSIGSVLVLVVYRTMPLSFLSLATYASLAKIYSNSLLSALNARISLRKMDSTTASVELPSRLGHRKAGSSTGFSSGTQHNPISIEMNTTTEVRGDHDNPY